MRVVVCCWNELVEMKLASSTMYEHRKKMSTGTKLIYWECKKSEWIWRHWWTYTNRTIRIDTIRTRFRLIEMKCWCICDMTTWMMPCTLMSMWWKRNDWEMNSTKWISKRLTLWVHQRRRIKMNTHQFLRLYNCKNWNLRDEIDRMLRDQNVNIVRWSVNSHPKKQMNDYAFAFYAYNFLMIWRILKMKPHPVDWKCSLVMPMNAFKLKHIRQRMPSSMRLNLNDSWVTSHPFDFYVWFT